MAAALGVSALPQSALAAGASNHCSLRTCTVTARNFPGGTISVDADSGGTSDTAFWGLTDGTSPNPRCSVSFPTNDPPRSWTCSGIHSGTVTVILTGPAPLSIGVRW
jgi:hypothetical protein